MKTSRFELQNILLLPLWHNSNFVYEIVM